MMAERLQKMNITPVELCEPTYGKYGAAMRKVMASGVPVPIPEQVKCFTSDRRAHVKSRILPLLELMRRRRRDFMILQHRYYLSAPVYQWRDDEQAVQVLRAQQAFAPRPDLVLLMDVSGRVASGRVSKRDGKSARADAGRLEDLRQRYLRFSKISGEPIVKIDASGSVDAVAALLWKSLQKWSNHAGIRGGLS